MDNSQNCFYCDTPADFLCLCSSTRICKNHITEHVLSNTALSHRPNQSLQQSLWKNCSMKNLCATSCSTSSVGRRSITSKAWGLSKSIIALCTLH
mmetsp:Transcript_18803/g.34103  ORF Transcript_18803/g.34103 Transcript_18803/m.34103 type:complete len:95 (+) Transcript_18803:1764-2048(+)